jgi:pimeloyl-ACP methyl ester carboxylesterase
MAPAEQFVRANGLLFRVLSWGPSDGRSILLLHGFPESADTWQPIAEALAGAGFHVFAFDQRGYSEGARPADPAAYHFDKFVADALAVADRCGLPKFDVAGFGMGAAQAWILAARHPERIRSLVALRFPHPAAFASGIEHDPAQHEAWNRLQEDFGGHSLDERARDMLASDAAKLRAFLGKSGLPQPHLDRYVQRLRQPGALTGALSWEHAVSLKDFSQVPVVRVPTLYLWSRGPALAPSTAEATRAYVSASYTFEEVEGAGNFMIETSPDQITRAMLRFYSGFSPEP